MSVVILAFMMLFGQTAVAPAVVRGIVVIGNSTEPIAQVDLELQPLNGTAAQPIVTASLDNGTFQFSRVPSGRYRLIGVRAGYPQAELALVLGTGQQMTDVRLAMTPGATISGRVIDRDGQPVTRAEVQAVKLSYPDGRASLRTMRSALTNDLGEYRMFWLAPGQYYVSIRPISQQTFGGTIVVNPDGKDIPYTVGTISTGTTARVPRALGLEENETYLTLYFPGTPDVHAATLVDVHPGEEIRDINVRIASARIARLRGTVTDPATRQSAPKTTRVFLTSLMPPASTSSSALIDNAFEFNAVLPGVYEIRASVPGTGRIGRSVIEVLDRDLDVNIPLISFNVSGGLAFDRPPAEGAPRLENLRVILRAASGFEVHAGPAADGSFILKDVPFGDYQVYVDSLDGTPDSYVKSIRMDESDVMSRGLRIEAAPPEQLRIVIGTRGASLTGHSLPGATVVLVPDQPAPLRLDQYKTATTNAAGEFQLRGISPGVYDVFAWRAIEPNAWLDPNFISLNRPPAKSLRVSEGQNVRLDVPAH